MKRILVALDRSERSKLVLAAATRLAQISDAKLVLFRAITVPSDLPREAFGTTAPNLEDVLKRHTFEDLQRLASTVPAGLVEEIAMEFATAWDGICRAARARDADVIVIGSHGFSGIDHVIGTTAAKVVNHADRNVFVVRTLV